MLETPAKLSPSRRALAFIDGFIKPAPRQAHGTSHAAYIMCQAIAEHGGFETLHVYREAKTSANGDAGELTLPARPPTATFDKSALASSGERYVAIYVANGSQMALSPYVLRPAHDWAPVVCSIGTAHASDQWSNLFVSLACGAVRPGDGLIFKSRAAEALFRRTWEAWHTRFAFVPPFPATTAVIANGVDVEANRRSDKLRAQMRAQLRLDDEDLVFLAFSRLSPATKGDQQAMVVRWKDVLARVPRAVLVLCGAVVDRGFVADLRALARAADVGARVLVIDNPFELASDARTRLMSAADVFLHLSTGLEEVSSLVVHEAMAHGLPVIVTSWAGMPDIVVNGENGFLVETRNGPLPAPFKQTVFGQSDLIHLTAASRVVATDWSAVVDAAAALADVDRRARMSAAARRAAELGALPTVARAYADFFAVAGREASRVWKGAAPIEPLVDLDLLVSAQATRALEPDARLRLGDPTRARLLSNGVYTEVPARVSGLLAAFEVEETLTVTALATILALGPTDLQVALASRLLVRLLNYGVLAYA